jgi:transcriptional regulator with XRE-family HTH domain
VPTPPPKTFGERVRFARKEAKLTQVQLAAKAGIGQSALSSIENDDTRWTRGPNLLRLASALDVDAEWLESGSGKMRHTHNPPDHKFTDVLSALSPDNRRRLLGMAHALLADQAVLVKPTVADPFPTAPKPPQPSPKGRQTTR